MCTEEQKKISYYEKIYFNRIKNILEENGTTIFRNLTTQYNFSVIDNPYGGASKVSKVMERVVQSIISENTDWEIFSLATSSDSSFITPKCVIHIDAKATKKGDGDDRENKITVGRNQVSYASNEDGIENGGKKFKSNIPYKYNHKIYGEVFSATYFIRIIYDYSNGIESFKNFRIILACIPNGLLKDIYGEEICVPGKVLERPFYEVIPEELYNSIIENMTEENKLIFDYAYKVNEVSGERVLKSFYRYEQSQEDSDDEEEEFSYLNLSDELDTLINNNEIDKLPLVKMDKDLYNFIVNRIEQKDKAKMDDMYTLNSENEIRYINQLNKTNTNKLISIQNRALKQHIKEKKDNLVRIYKTQRINESRQTMRIKLDNLKFEQGTQYFGHKDIDWPRWKEIELF